ncbi:hypothetical protein [Pedobacter sp. CFBP9032]|uniref:hypothetical protein n=1 Tax=Pedobacter sp. CFBP9032 TaxID=3096539 RepID=UPI002A6A157A|nr:hypothetical protein [Pedobacter sp. CFBP9032]MDY0905210.1 hypothetical protein [Pedobacter sp. CFBP9032]
MLLRNLQLQPLSIEEIKQSLRNLDDVSIPDQDELEIELGDYYNTALTLDASNNDYTIKYKGKALESNRGLFKINGSKILEQIRVLICKFLSREATLEDFIDIILEAIATIIPGGVFMEWLVKKLIKFLYNKGYDLLCPVTVIS